MHPLIVSSIPLHSNPTIKTQEGFGFNRLNQMYKDSVYRREFCPEGITLVSDSIYENLSLNREYSDTLAKLLKDFDDRKHVIEQGGRHSCYPIETDAEVSFLRFDRFHIGDYGRKFISSGIGEPQVFTYVRGCKFPDFEPRPRDEMIQQIETNKNRIQGFLDESFMNCGVLNFNKIYAGNDNLPNRFQSSVLKDATEIKIGDNISCPKIGYMRSYIGAIKLINEYLIVLLWTWDGAYLLAYKKGQKVRVFPSRFEENWIPALSIMKGMTIRYNKAVVKVSEVNRPIRSNPLIYLNDSRTKNICVIPDNSPVEVLDYESVHRDRSTYEGVQEGEILNWLNRDTTVLSVFHSDSEKLCHLILEDTRTGNIGYRVISYSSKRF